MAIRLIIRRREAGGGGTRAEQTFDGPIVTIGSDPGASLHLEDLSVAPEQAIIIGGEEGEPPLFINRADGTLLNGEQLAREARRPLSDGDSISIGPFVISLQTGNGFRPGAAPPGLESDAPQADAGRAAPVTRETHAPPDDAAPPKTQQPTSFAAILDSLRTEEDTFYFQVETATAGRRRVPVEATGLLLGWDRAGQNVACGYGVAVETVRAVVLKDWSGVVLQPEGAGAVAVNGEPVEAARRLRNGDRVTLSPVAGSSGPDAARNFFIFYEPASLVVLDSLLPAQQLPPPVAAPPPAGREDAAAALVPAPSPPPAVRAPHGRPPAARTYFGYFTLGEVALMACATLAAAFVIFLILEYS
ncbi:MAG TPA: FHA domain-containing protein [Pyrinomonadaceae bacterium]|jgi:pSer/pThr/pTyr-binding forkhead associated (FHA) protein/sulfur carrier protein ThiS